MTIKYTSSFLASLKKAHVTTRRQVKKRMLRFAKNPNDPQLHNHSLKREYEGYYSVNITSDYRAIYKKGEKVDNERVVYFTSLGTHKELYRSEKKNREK